MAEIKSREWSGLATPAMSAEADAAVHQVADAAKLANWGRMFDLFEQHPWLDVGCTRPGGKSLFTPLHQAAWHGATEAAERLIRLGASRVQRNAQGRRPIAVAAGRGHTDLMSLLEPVVSRPLASAVLTGLDVQLRALIASRTGHLNLSRDSRYPTVELLTEEGPDALWCPVPGMYGGFQVHLMRSYLFVESWSRVVGGSGQAHVVTTDGYTLVEEGFV